jgi:hypothetical protein
VRYELCFVQVPVESERRAALNAQTDIPQLIASIPGRGRSAMKRNWLPRSNEPGHCWKIEKDAPALYRLELGKKVAGEEQGVNPKDEKGN